MTSFHDQALRQLRADLQVAEAAKMSSADVLNGVLRFTAKWRSHLIARTIIAHSGTIIQGGPFQGMDYVSAASEGALAARLLGCYESAIHQFIEVEIQKQHSEIVNIGCAEGYYAVGFALRLPNAKVDAFDISPTARDKCRELARANGVASRVAISGEFKADNINRYSNGALFIVDIEGAEVDLLRSISPMDAKHHTFIIETHPSAAPGAIDILSNHFYQTHKATITLNTPGIFSAPQWLAQSQHIDLVLAAWEWRSSATPWLILHPKS